MKLEILYLFIAAILMVSVQTATCQTYSVQFTIKNFRSDKGQVIASLYNSEKGYPKQPKYAFRSVHASISGRQCSILFEGVPSGIYALAFIHDENNNGKFDSNFFNYPLEGAGASNNAKGFLGPPKFSDAKFMVTQNVQQTIMTNYW